MESGFRAHCARASATGHVEPMNTGAHGRKFQSTCVLGARKHAQSTNQIGPGNTIRAPYPYMMYGCDTTDYQATLCCVCMHVPAPGWFGSLSCNHPVCWYCQLQLDEIRGCPCCRRPVVDVSAWYITFVRKLWLKAANVHEALEYMAGVFIWIKFGHDDFC